MAPDGKVRAWPGDKYLSLFLITGIEMDLITSGVSIANVKKTPNKQSLKTGQRPCPEGLNLAVQWGHPGTFFLFILILLYTGWDKSGFIVVHMENHTVINK